MIWNSDRMLLVPAILWYDASQLAHAWIAAEAVDLDLREADDYGCLKIFDQIHAGLFVSVLLHGTAISFQH